MLLIVEFDSVELDVLPVEYKPDRGSNEKIGF